MIIYNMLKKDYFKIKDEEFFGTISKEHPFIHCSTIQNFCYVTPRFKDIKEEMVIILLDENKLSSVVKYENGAKVGVRLYPHIYGLINKNAVIKVLPLILDNEGNWIKNKEIIDYK